MKVSKQGSARGKRRQSAPSIVFTALTALAVGRAEDTACPSSTNGWAASADCKSYFWCSAGARSSITYECIDNTLYNVVTSACQSADSFECNGTSSPVSAPETEWGIDWAANGVSAGEQLGLVALTEATEAAESSDGLAMSMPSAPVTSTGPTEEAADESDTNDSVTAIMDAVTAPTLYPTKLGPPLYYGDFRTSSCLSAAADPDTIASGVGIPGWLTEDLMYQSKEECCSDMFGWAPLENCLGEGFVETNYVKGTHSPTASPSLTPTGVPSYMPSLTFAPSAAPTVNASDVPSVMPTYTPSALPSYSPSRITMVPTLTPTTEAPSTLTPTMAPTTPVPTENVVVVTPEPSTVEDGAMASYSSNVEYETQSDSIPATDTESVSVSRPPSDPTDPSSFLVELLGWANSDYSPTDETDPTPSPTEEPASDSFAISEIILPILEDATISLQRQSLNFGANSALAVDGGATTGDQTDGLGERFDSLLKFDVGMIDDSRPLEKAVLRIFALAECASGGTFVTTSDASWDQESVTWESSPEGDGYEIGTIGSVSSNTWYELDVLAALSWNDSLSAFSANQDVISIRISSSMSSRCMYSSMESGQAKSPYMSVRYGTSDVIQEFSSVANDPPVSGQFILLRSTDDATLDGTNPVASLGTDPNLRVSFDTSSRGISDAVIRFDLSELAGASPVAAVLSLYAESDCPSAGTIMTTEGDSSWSESDITWSTASSYKKDTPGGGFNLGTFGQVTSNTWYGFDVVQAVKKAVAEGKTAVTFRISTATDGECTYSSRESGRDPKMMVAF